MALQIYNVLHREKQDFVPLVEGKVNMYVCGPTVQDYAHLGHAKTYINFDIINKYLRWRGYDVLYVQNITDVGHLLDTGEDRILKKARQLAAGPMQIVEHYTRHYFEDMDALGIQRPDISPRASAHVPEQIKMTQTLIDKGYAYEVDGSVYFDVLAWDDYGKLSNRRVEDQDVGTREAVREEKRHPADFALWKRAEPEHILRWDSPWGVGFPGWHIECSAMAGKYLGPHFDIHGGGIDNIFPHNECEIAQSEAANEQPFANYWILVGSLMVPDEFGVPVKMSKSLDNFVTIKDALAKYSPHVIRTFIASSNYRNPTNYSEEAIEAASNGWTRIATAVHLTRELMLAAPEGEAGNAIYDILDRTRDDFVEAMDDDFNAPAALASLHDLTRDVNSLLNGQQEVGAAVLRRIDETYTELGTNILGVVPEHTVNYDPEREADLIRLLIELRSRARQEKDFQTSDRIRDYLSERGVTLEDRPDRSTFWKVF
ncbi:MAG: cysteine--tRNA ligase [Chloroflexi bacterium]|nr:cysteine--tRNA ligase [Chloroflexota bacterium]